MHNIILGARCVIALKWVPLEVTKEKLTLFPVEVWCRQVTTHVDPNLKQHMASLSHAVLTY